MIDDLNPGLWGYEASVLHEAVADLAKELLEIEATGDRERAENWFKKYGQMPESLKVSLKMAADVPVDVDPVFAFPERVK